MESEYDWPDLAEEYWLTSAIWVWSFIVIICLLMLNMVVAIILESYNEVRLASAAGEPLWDTVAHFCLRLIHARHWVGESIVEARLHDQLSQSIIERQDIYQTFPEMPMEQADLLFSQCREDMSWEAEKDLDTVSLLNLAGSVTSAVEAVSTTVQEIKDEESESPLKAWITPTSLPMNPDLGDLQQSFLTSAVTMKGSEQPNLVEADSEQWELKQPEEPPEWLKGLGEMLIDQRKWLQYAQWQVKQMRWKIQLAHVEKLQQIGSDVHGPLL